MSDALLTAVGRYMNLHTSYHCTLTLLSLARRHSHFDKMVQKVMVTQDASCGTNSEIHSSQDASCGPDEPGSSQWDRSGTFWHSYESGASEKAGNCQHWNWPWWKKGHQNVEVETKQTDLFDAAEKQQHAQDEAYIRSYYEKKAEKRKRNNENRREHVWQASERIAMSANDYPVRGTTTGRSTTDDFKQASALVQASETEQKPDKTKLSSPQNSKSTTLKASILAVASNLDGDRASKCRRTGDASSGPGISREQRITLDGPYWSGDQLQPPMDRNPEIPILKCFPQPRTAGYNRLTPKLNGRYAGGANIVKPPYGIQLIESFRLWRENMSKAHA